nr:nonstructural protein [Sika deer copiparvovirus]
MLSYYYGTWNCFPSPEIIPGIAKDPYVKKIRLLKGGNYKWPELDEKYLFAAQCCQGLFIEICKQCRIECKTIKDPPIFIQLEEGEHGKLHAHFVISTTVGTARDMSQIFKTAEQQFNFYYLGTRGIVWNKPKKNRNGSWSTCNENFIKLYLLPKLPMNQCLYAWTTMDGEYADAYLNTDEREKFKQLKRKKQYLLTNNKEEEESDDEAGPIFKKASGEQMINIVQFLVENDITTEEKWQQKYFNSYCTFLSSTSGTHLLKSSLTLARSTICREKSLALSLCGFKNKTQLLSFLNEHNPTSMEENNIWKLFLQNGYDPDEAAAILYAWSRKITGKRNAIWISGPPTTGKSNLGQAIARSAACYGCVNWNNKNFPFMDIINTQVAIWDEGIITEDIIEQTKCVLAGQETRIDRKCTTSVPCIPPCFFITSNQDITLVQNGNLYVTTHRRPLEDRMLHFTFDQKCKTDMGLLGQNDIRNFWRWGAYCLHKANHNRYSLLRKPPTEWPFVIPKNATETAIGYVLKKKPLWPTDTEDEDIIYIDDEDILEALEPTENIDSILEDPENYQPKPKVRNISYII